MAPARTCVGFSPLAGTQSPVASALMIAVAVVAPAADPAIAVAAMGTVSGAVAMASAISEVVAMATPVAIGMLVMTPAMPEMAMIVGEYETETDFRPPIAVIAVPRPAIAIGAVPVTIARASIPVGRISG
ncbi:MAG: hypothetical protein ACE5FO_10170 [Parvularculaceae bacterium]